MHSHIHQATLCLLKCVCVCVCDIAHVQSIEAYATFTRASRILLLSFYFFAQLAALPLKYIMWQMTNAALKAAGIRRTEKNKHISWPYAFGINKVQHEQKLLDRLSLNSSAAAAAASDAETSQWQWQ